MAEEDGLLLIAANSASKTGNRIVWTPAFGLAAIALLTVVILIWAIRKNRLRRIELQQRDDALRLLTDAIKATQIEGVGRRRGGEFPRSRDRACVGRSSRGIK